MAQLVIGVKYKTDIAVTTQSNLPLSRAFRRRTLAIASDSFALLRFTLVSRAFHCFDVLYWLFFVATRFWLDHLVLLLATRRALVGVFVAARFWLDHLVLFPATRRAPTGVFLFVGHFVCHVQPFSIVRSEERRVGKECSSCVS